jgi:tetratricopeptide (TPR) repeat protein
MKKISLFVVGCFAAGHLYAQNSAVTSATLYHKDGLLDKAKTEIDKASQHEKTSTKAKTWYYKGVIYEDIFASPLPSYTNLSEDPATEAYHAYKKAIELEKPGGEYDKNSQARLESLWANSLNKSVAAYNNKELPKAMKLAQLAQNIKPEDTTAYVYTASFAAGMEDYGKMSEAYQKLIDLGHSKKEYYSYMAYAARKVNNDDNKALEIITEGRKHYPADKELMLEELNLYFATGRTNEVKSKLEEAVKADPGNASLHYNLGAIYDQEANDTKKSKAEKDALKKQAIESYEKALAADNKNFDAAFNLGAIYYNQAADVVKKVNSMDLGTYQKEGKKYEAQARQHFEKALPYFETAYAVQPKDANVLTSLKTIYTALKRKEDVARVDKELSAVEKQ